MVIQIVVQFLHFLSYCFRPVVTLRDMEEKTVGMLHMLLFRRLNTGKNDHHRQM